MVYNVYHGTTVPFKKLEIKDSFGIHFGTLRAAHERIQKKSVENICIDISDCYVPELNKKTSPYKLNEVIRNACSNKKERLEFKAAYRIFQKSIRYPNDKEHVERQLKFYLPFEYLEILNLKPSIIHSHIFRCHLNINNWYDCDDIYEWHEENNLNEIFKCNERKTIPEIKQMLVDQGYDSIRYRNECEDEGSFSWIVFDTNDIIYYIDQ